MRLGLALATTALLAHAEEQKTFLLEKASDFVPISCLKKTFLLGPDTKSKVTSFDDTSLIANSVSRQAYLQSFDACVTE